MTHSHGNVSTKKMFAFSSILALWIFVPWYCVAQHSRNWIFGRVMDVNFDNQKFATFTFNKNFRFLVAI